MFLIKKVISELMYPVPLIMLVCFILLILTIKRKKKGVIEYLIIVQVSLFALFAYSPFPRFLASSLERTYPMLKTIPEGVTTIVVLGGGSASDPELPTSSQLSTASLIRLTEGIALFNKMDSANIIVTGGAVLDTATIASLQRKMAISLGVDSTRISMADSALTTEMEAVTVKKMVTNPRIILVSSALHLPRAVALFKKAGLDPIPAPTNYLYRNTPFSPTDLFPSPYHLETATASFHEYLGLIWSKIRNRI